MGTATPALALASSFSLEEGEAKAVQTCTIMEGNLKVVLRDNARSPKVLSGLASLFHQKDAPAFDAYDPDSPGASAGLNFEHIISGHKNANNAFSPRHGAPKDHADWNQGGPYRSALASALEYDADHNFKLNSWSYSWPRFTKLPVFRLKPLPPVVFRMSWMACRRRR